MTAWNGWYHVSIHTYGTWLPGDKRGWRARHHKRHVDGDYKDPPPPGEHDGLLDYSKEQMKHPPVYLNLEERRIVGQAVVEMLVDQGLELLVLSVDAVHCHLLARLGSVPSRSAVGKAKQHAYHVLREQCGRLRLWGKRGRARPVRDRSHQLRAYKYILDHAEEGAWVWTFKQGLYWRE